MIIGIISLPSTVLDKIIVPINVHIVPYLLQDCHLKAVHDLPMAAFPQIWTLYLLGLLLSILARCCLKASLLLLSAELYSTCSSSHGFHSSATNGAAPPSLTPPANTILFQFLGMNFLYLSSHKRKWSFEMLK